jgi:CRP/FNR family cyclic AMP-dependent transcriptional regulator
MDDLAHSLGRVRHFRGLPAAALQAIVSAGQVKRFSVGEMIFQEGEPCAGMFVLLSGRVHLCKMGQRGQQQIMAIIEPVIMFNEVAVLDGGKNPVMALAVDNCLTWTITCAAFQTLLSVYPQVGLGLLPVLAARNRALLSRFEDMSYRSVLARTAKLLLNLSDDGNRVIIRREHSVDEMSERIGTVREPVSRALRTLCEGGIIACTRATITVCNREALAEQAHIDMMTG